MIVSLTSPPYPLVHNKFPSISCAKLCCSFFLLLLLSSFLFYYSLLSFTSGCANDVMKQYLSYTLISLWSAVYFFDSSRAQSILCIGKSSIHCCYCCCCCCETLSILSWKQEDYLASESRYLNSCQSCIDFRVGRCRRALVTHDVEIWYYLHA